MAAASTASELARPNEPGELGSAANAAWPVWVWSLGLGPSGLRAEALHDDAPVGLLVVADLDHIHFQVEPEEVAGHGQRCPTARRRSRSLAPWCRLPCCRRLLNNSSRVIMFAYGLAAA